MKAAYIEQTGPPDNIRYGDLPVPHLQPRQVLVKVGAVSVNPIDTYLRNGANYWEMPMPFVIGCDLAGTVEAVGADAARFKPGDRVWGSNQGLLGRQGTFAEYCAVDEDWLYPTPSGVSDDDAAACALVGITAHLGLFREARLQAGETVFVHGGTGGVGAMVLQMAKAAGARVIATAGDDAKANRCRELGADEVILYKSQDEAAEAKRLAPAGVNVFWETLREPDFDRIVAVLAERGRIVLMAGRDARPQFPVGPFYVKGCSLHGFVMFKATPDEQRACAADINRWLAEGKLRAQIGRTFPLAEAAAAHRLQEVNTLNKTGTLAGKIVLRP
ncbi:MAG: NADPH:quinone reductase [Planctomycetales bacterium]|nr:NADPH:quinone reductase [Planctomycetales bacterium]